jgi:fatty-acyl-CoA synthase
LVLHGRRGLSDEDGYLTIINGEFNVYPKEIEDRLTGQPGVLMAAVVGIPDGIRGKPGLPL